MTVIVILSASEVSQINCSRFFDCPSLTVHLRMTIKRGFFDCPSWIVYLRMTIAIAILNIVILSVSEVSIPRFVILSASEVSQAILILIKSEVCFICVVDIEFRNKFKR